MILLSALVTARRGVILPSPPPSPLPHGASYFFLLFFFCYLYTKPSRVVAALNSGDDGVGVGGVGGSSGSRKSQINPFVIRHLSFQPVRISTTSLLCHLPKLFPFFSSVSPYRAPVKRDSTIPPSLYLSLPTPRSPRLTLPYFHHFFLSLSLVLFPLDPFHPLSSLRRTLTCELLFLFRSFPVHIFHSRNFTGSSLLRFDSNSSRQCAPDRICFVCFSCADPLNRNFLAHSCVPSLRYLAPRTATEMGSARF